MRVLVEINLLIYKRMQLMYWVYLQIVWLLIINRGGGITADLHTKNMAPRRRVAYSDSSLVLLRMVNLNNWNIICFFNDPFPCTLTPTPQRHLRLHITVSIKIPSISQAVYPQPPRSECQKLIGPLAALSLSDSWVGGERNRMTGKLAVLSLESPLNFNRVIKTFKSLTQLF